MKTKFSAFLFFIYCLFLNVLNIKAQNSGDTISLSEVKVLAQNLKRFQAGSKIETVNPILINQLQDGNLGDLLTRVFPVAIKTDAGSLSTIRIRGTSPNHTSINFGEIDLNSLTLGNSNLVTIPVYLFDEISLQYGSSATIKGSGNIGGALHLGLTENWVKGAKAEVRLAFGSFGEQLYATKLFFGNGKWESVTRFYYYKKLNDFPFFNTDIKNFSTGQVGVYDVQRNARLNNKGILQEINYLFSPAHSLKFNIWVENDFHNIQQNQVTNYYNPDYKEDYEENHIRSTLSYDNRQHNLKYHLGLAQSFDEGIYNHTKNEIKTNNFIADAFVEQDITSKISYKTGFKYSRIYPEVYAYDSSLSFENRTDLYFLYNQQVLNRLRITINLRQGLVTNYKVPFLPALGFSYSAFYNNTSILKLNGNISKSYRVPGFNDRFWVRGGNPILEPEKGTGGDLGIQFDYQTENFRNSIQLNAFFIDVNNWILWRGGGSDWYADNVQRVKSMGFEFTNNLTAQFGQMKINGLFHYSFTKSQRVESETGSPALFRQLEYVPIHLLVFNLLSDYKSMEAGLDLTYSSKQYTDEEEKNILPGLVLLNFSAGRNFKINNFNHIEAKLLINNLLNKNYQSSFSYAMPGINYRISIMYHFK
ncbi:MAG: TonB-dependent receptor plug domain-containing protein [Bacteroidales bacterium]